MYEIGEIVFIIKSDHDELPTIKEMVVIPLPRMGDRGVEMGDPEYPGESDGARLRREWKRNDQVTNDMAVAKEWLLNDIDQRIESFQGDIVTLREYRDEIK